MKNDVEIKRIHTAAELMAIMMKNDENIVYGAGYMSHILMRNLFYKELHRLVLCVAVEDDFVNPTEVYDIPVVALRYLPHFYRTASFYLALSEKTQNGVIDLLQEKGCKYIYTISDKVFNELQKEFEDFPTNHIVDLGARLNLYRASKMEREVLLQPETVRTNTDTFDSFREINKGKDVVLLATGPSASEYKKINKAIHLGINTSPLLEIPIDYYFAQDNRAFKKNSVDEVIDKCKGEIFIGRIADKAAYSRTMIDISGIYRPGIHQYFVNNPCMTEDLVKDICKHSLTDYYSIVFAALQFALFTSPSKIYIVGCDVSGKLEHFNEKSKTVVSHSKFFKLGYGLFKRFAEIYYPNIEIVSINPIGLKGLFEDYYQEVL